MRHHEGEAGAHQPSRHPERLSAQGPAVSECGGHVVNQIRPDHSLSWGRRVNRVGDLS